MEFHDTSLVLEGGGSRGVFTAGVLDYLLEKKIDISYVVGVSAGSCNAVDYVAGQAGRTKECMIVKEKAYRYVSLHSIIHNKSLFDMDMVFDKFPNQYIPFDYDQYFQSTKKCEIVATNCLTGKPEYFHEDSSRSRIMQVCRASSSLPFMGPMVMLDGVPYLDGGISDSIPLARAFKQGNKKHVVILTRYLDYRKKVDSREAVLAKMYERKYPLLAKSIIRRPLVYNRTLDIIEKMERQGQIFVIRPCKYVVGRAETNHDKLETFYQHGYDMMKDQFDAMLAYLKGEE